MVPLHLESIFIAARRGFLLWGSSLNEGSLFGVPFYIRVPYYSGGPQKGPLFRELPIINK